jgi:hypothetical protein
MAALIAKRSATTAFSARMAVARSALIGRFGGTSDAITFADNGSGGDMGGVPNFNRRIGFVLFTAMFMFLVP